MDYEVRRIDKMIEIVDAYGAVDFDNSKILIDSELKGSRLMVTLTHEIVHAIMYEMGAFEQSEDEEEEFVTRMAPIVAMLLRDNDFSFMIDKTNNVEYNESNYDLNYNEINNNE